jgi:hypothetical protein
MRHRRLLQSVLLLVGYLSTLHALTVRQYHCQHHHLWASSSSSSTRTASSQTAITSDASYNTPTRFGRHHVLFAVPVVATASFLWQSSSLSMSWQSSDDSDNDDDTHNGNSSPPDVLHRLLQSEMDGSRTSLSPILLPCCYDGLTARLVARYRSSTTGSDDQGTHGIQSGLGCFDATFLTGFGASAVYGYPDTQLVSYDEMLATCRTVSAALASVALEQEATNRVKQPRRLRRRPPIPCIAVRAVLYMDVCGWVFCVTLFQLGPLNGLALLSAFVFLVLSCWCVLLLCSLSHFTHKTRITGR